MRYRADRRRREPGVRDIERRVKCDAVRDDSDEIVRASPWVSEKMRVNFFNHPRSILKKENGRVRIQSTRKRPESFHGLGGFDADDQVLDGLRGRHFGDIRSIIRRRVTPIAIFECLETVSLRADMLALRGLNEQAISIATIGVKEGFAMYKKRDGGTMSDLCDAMCSEAADTTQTKNVDSWRGWSGSHFGADAKHRRDTVEEISIGAEGSHIGGNLCSFITSERSLE